MNVMTSVNKRYSTRYYETNKKINENDMQLILEAGRKAPNGFGIEAWLFYVIDGDKSNLRKLCWDQEHVETSSHVIAMAYYNKDYIDKNQDFVTDKYIKSNINRTYKDIQSYLTDQYLREQTFFAASQMVLQATDLGIGSVVVGGYEDKEPIEDLIGMDRSISTLSILITMGYALDSEPKIRYNRDLSEIVRRVTL